MSDPILKELQRRIENLGTDLTRLARRVAGNEQSTMKNWGFSPRLPDSATTNVYFAVTPSSSSWPGGAPSGGTPGSFTANVYKISGGAYVLVASSATIYNGYPSSPDVSKTVALGANGDGTYSVIGESCT